MLRQKLSGHVETVYAPAGKCKKYNIKAENNRILNSLLLACGITHLPFFNNFGGDKNLAQKDKNVNFNKCFARANSHLGQQVHDIFSSPDMEENFILTLVTTRDGFYVAYAFCRYLLSSLTAKSYILDLLHKKILH
jgi:hypothetical protein